MRRIARVLVVFAATGLLLAGCATAGSPAASLSPSAPVSSSPTPSGELVVFAASSLQEAFTTLGKQFEAAHPGVTVVLDFGASSSLATQIKVGAPADVFASASTKNMDQVVEAGAATSATTFASNIMEIAVPPSNPAGVAELSDLAKPAVKMALCQVTVPCGATAEQVLSNAKLTVAAVTQEVDVKSVLSKVTLGEVDAGIVYVTDVRAARDKVKGIEIAADVNASTRYPIATLTNAPNMAAAKAFTAYVLSPAGASVLASDGFAKP